MHKPFKYIDSGHYTHDLAINTQLHTRQWALGKRKKKNSGRRKKIDNGGMQWTLTLNS